MANTIGAKIVLEGEAEYRKAIKNINAEQKELRSEMKLASSEFSSQQNSIEALTKKNDILAKQYQSQSDKVEIYTKAVADSTKKQEEAEKKVAELRKALEKATDTYGEMKDNADTSTDALEEQQKTIEELKNKLALAEDSYQKTQTATSNWKTSLNHAQVSLNEMSDELTTNKRYIEEAQNSTDGCAKSIDEYGQEVAKASEKTSVFGDVLKANLTSEVIINGVKAIANGIADISKAAVSYGKDFEKSMSQVAATMGMTAEEIANGSEAYELLKVAAEEAGATTKFSASEAAEALNYLALAGYDAEKSAETLPKVLNLAASGGLDLAYASDLVTDAMAALGMETSDLDMYIDQMAKTSQKSNTSVAQLGEATLVCAGAVSLAKQPLDTMNAQLGVLANNGIKGAEGGTHLRNIILSLVTPTDVGAKALAELGVKVSDSSGAVRNMNDVMTDLNTALSGMSDSARSDYISTIFNKTDISAVNALLKGTGSEINNLYKEINNCTGAAQDMAETMEANLAGKISTLESALEGLGITAYEKVEGTLKESVDAATESIDLLNREMSDGELGEAMDEFAEELGKAADGAIEFASDALPALIEGLTWVMQNADLVKAGIGGITTATIYHSGLAPAITSVMNAWNAYKVANEGATIAQWALNSAMNANPAGLLVTAIVGLTSALAIYKATTANAMTETQKFVEEIHEKNNAIQDTIASRATAQASEQAELEIIGRLKDELVSLNEKEVLSNSEKERMKMIVDELNQAMPELNLSFDEETQKLSETNEELESYIENMQESLMVGFMREDLEEIARDLYEAEKSLAEAQENYDTALSESRQVMFGWMQACKEGDQAMREFNEELGEHATDAMAKYEEKRKSLIPALEESRELVATLKNEYAEMSAKLEEAVNPTQELTDATKELETEMVEYKGEVYEVSKSTAESMKTIQSAYDETYQEAHKSITGQVGLFEELSLASDLTAKDMARSLQSQAVAFTTYKKDMLIAVELVEKGLLDEGLLGAIKELEMDGAAYLHELLVTAEEDTQAFADVMNEWARMVEARDNLEASMSDMENNYTETMDAMLNIQSEVDEDIVKEAESLAEKIKETMDMEESAETFDQTLKKYETSVTNVSKSTVKNIEEVKSAYQEAYEEADQTLNGQISLFEELSLASDLSAKDMIKNLQSQTNTMAVYQNDMMIAAALVEQGLLDEGMLGALRELGIDGAGYLHTLVTTARDDTQTFNSLMGEWALMNDAKESLTDTLATIEAGYSESMDSVMNIQSEKNLEITQEAERLGAQIIASLNGTFEQTTLITESGLTDMTDSVKEKTPEVKKATTELCSASISGAEEVLQMTEDGTSTSYVSVGYSIPQGIAQGITDGSDLVAGALQSVINNAIQTIDMSGFVDKINRELGELL